MSLEETTAVKVISLFSIEKPDWIGKFQCALQPSDIPLVGGYYMISRPDHKRFKTTKLRRKNPGLTFFRIHGNRTGLGESLRNILPTLGNNVAQPKSADVLTRKSTQAHASAMRAFFRPPDKFRSFTFQKKSYKVIVKDGDLFPWRWHFDDKQYWLDTKRATPGSKVTVSIHDYYSHHILPASGFLDTLFDSVSDLYPTEYDNYLEDIYEPEGFSPTAIS